MKLWIGTVFALPLFTVLLLAAPAKDEQAEAEAILDKAIAAAGGQDKLAKLKSFTIKCIEKNWNESSGTDSENTAEYSYDYPDRERRQRTRGIGETTFTSTTILNGDKAWLTADGKTRRIEDKVLPDALAEFTEFPVRKWPLYKDKGYKLAPLGESKVGDKRVVGVKALFENKPDAKLFFDKETGLLIKGEYDLSRLEAFRRGGTPSRAESESGKAEILLEEYKEANGIKYPTKLTATSIEDGKKHISRCEITEFKVVEKFDEKTFAEPK
jgi:hypothetical protein